MKHLFPDIVPGGLAFATMCGVILALAEVVIFGRIIGKPDLLVDFKKRAAWLATGGVVLGTLFALALFIYEAHDQAEADKAQAQL